MGASSDYMEEVGPSSKGEVDDMDMDEDLMDTTNLNELGRETLQSFCKKAASLFFFDEYGLISHQINSYNAFINSGLQRVFDSFGEVAVEPGYDTSKQKDGEWRRASVRLGKVTLNRPSFWGGTSSDAEHNMFFRHARLQNMTYSARMKIHVNVQVYTQTVGRSDKCKTGIDKVDQKNVVHTENREIIIGRMPVMGWTVSYNSEVKRNRLIVRLVELSKLEYIKGEKKGLCVYFLSIEIPIWILFLPLVHKALFLGYMVKCLLEAYTGHMKCDNRDSFRNKRFELASELLERELKVHVSHALKCMTKALQRDLYGDRDVHPIKHYLDASMVTNGLTRAFSTGAWCHPFKWMGRVYGVVGNLGRANPLQTMIDLRKTRQQVLYTRKVGHARYPHPSHWESLVDELFDSGMEKLGDDTYTKLDGKHKVFLNGEWVEIKRDEQQREVRIFSDAGRILLPLIVVENLDKIKAFKGGNYIFASLRDKGIIGFIGTEEEEDCCTAWGIRFLLEDIAGKQSMKVLYQAQKHSQQAIGFSTTNPNIRVDTLSHQLHYPQRPLFRTMISDCLGKPGYPFGHNTVLPKPELFNGQNAIVAVNVHLGYNQEDSLVMKRASLGRVLDDDGFSFIGANMQSGDIVIGKCAESGTDHRVKMKHTERGMVQKVVLSSNDEGKNFAVVSWRQNLWLADATGAGFPWVDALGPFEPNVHAFDLLVLETSFSSMHGQKGVLGFLESQENFPFTIQGVFLIL
ncbi:hypothetical protein OIU85_004118 [Salix viminalis]|uniref:DNA-directed RNA polymerase n=1 Tax=Salix viminalis TaxID=40686 RepID=A0A9Q0SXG9_SALVM|nr:hypothetical protein OIU85_004118 [Salix viminalis]